ncbi:fructose-bisphosphate aldolase [Candidatus Micrarchaeota archaeon]|nr:fructose-bisphosphate aldolase [Candidatus Micrarchaeota archaeon]
MDGKARRMKRILKEDGRTVILAFDHGFEHGPAKYENIDIRPERIIEIAQKGNADAIMVHKGQIQEPVGKLGLIIKITARSSLSPSENEMQEIVTEVEDAIAWGADAIALTVYVGAELERLMLRNFAYVYGKCRRYGIPLVGFMYPRGKSVKERYGEEYVRYAARIGSELNVDIIKTYYPGNKRSWEKVIAGSFKPVVAAGGALVEDKARILKIVKDVVDVGGAGVAVGRNVWERKTEEGIRLLRNIAETVHK